MQITKKTVFVGLMLSKLFQPLFSLLWTYLQAKNALQRVLVVHCRWREWEGNWAKLLQIVGETDSPEPVTGVTGCDGLHVTGADGL